jgi:hypothetical protein
MSIKLTACINKYNQQISVSPLRTDINNTIP